MDSSFKGKGTVQVREICPLLTGGLPHSVYLHSVGDAVASLFQGQQPDLSWIGQREATLSYPL